MYVAVVIIGCTYSTGAMALAAILAYRNRKVDPDD